MNQHTGRSRLLIALGIAGVLALTACGDDDSPAAGDAQSEAMTTEPAQSAEDTVAVTGVEYAFEGIPGTVAAGTELTFANGGEEAHELVLLGVAEGETRSVQELLGLPEEEARTVTSLKGVAVAPPGGDGQVVEGELVVDEPGRYLAVCFIPVGTTEMPKGPPTEGGEQGGPPHFTRGMVTEFTVE